MLLQRCLDRDIISVEEAEAAAESGDEVGDRVRLGISAAVLLSAAVRTADDAALANKARIVLASGDAVVSNDSVPAALQEALAMVLEAKKQLASPHHRTAEDRVRLCRDLVRAAIDGGSKASARPTPTSTGRKTAGRARTRWPGFYYGARPRACPRKNGEQRATPPWTTSSSSRSRTASAASRTAAWPTHLVPAVGRAAAGAAAAHPVCGVIGEFVSFVHRVKRQRARSSPIHRRCPQQHDGFRPVRVGYCKPRTSRSRRPYGRRGEGL